MHQVPAVELGHGQEQVAEELASVVFAQSALLVDEFPQVAVRAVLHHLEHAVALQYRLVDPNNVVVSKSLNRQ